MDEVSDEMFYSDAHRIIYKAMKTLHNNNIIIRNCTADGAECLLSLKMRPDTNQLNENILIEKIRGYCKKIFSTYSFTQFRRSPDLHMSYGRDITFQNLDLECDKIITAEDSIEYKLKNIILRDCNFKCSEAVNIAFNAGRDFIIENVKITP